MGKQTSLSAHVPPGEVSKLLSEMLRRGELGGRVAGLTLAIETLQALVQEERTALRFSKEVERRTEDREQALLNAIATLQDELNHAQEELDRVYT